MCADIRLSRSHSGDAKLLSYKVEASTTFGNLFRLTLTSAVGNYNMTWHLFASLLPSRFLPSIFSSSSSTPHTISFHPQNVSAIALGVETSAGDREVWALADVRAQRRVMKSEEWEDLLLDTELLDQQSGNYLAQVSIRTIRPDLAAAV